MPKDELNAPKQVEPLRPDVQAEKFYAPPPEKAATVCAAQAVDQEHEPATVHLCADCWDDVTTEIEGFRASQPEVETVHRYIGVEKGGPWYHCPADAGCSDSSDWEHATIRRKP